MRIYIEVVLIIIAVVILFYVFFHYAGILLAPSSELGLGSVCLSPTNFGEEGANNNLKGRQKSSKLVGDEGENCFYVELAQTAAQRDKGLMYRKELDRNRGMLFIFSAEGGSASGGDKEGNYPFWMKNTLIPLDIVWINNNNKVVFIANNVQPCRSLVCPSVNPKIDVKYVLEINAGLCEEMGLKLGDRLDIKMPGGGT